MLSATPVAMKKALITLSCILLISYSSTLQAQNQALQELAWKYMYKWVESWEDSTQIDALSADERTDLLFGMIHGNSRGNQWYYPLFQRLLNDGVSINEARSGKGLTLLETAISERKSEVVALLIQNGATITDSVTICDHCQDIKELPTLGAVVDFADWGLLQELMSRGVRPDSLFCAEIFDKVGTGYEHEDFLYSFFPYDMDAGLQLEEGTVVDYLVRKQLAREVNIQPIDQYMENYRRLIKKLILRENEGIEALLEEVMDFQKRYVLKEDRDYTDWSFMDDLYYLAQVSGLKGHHPLYISMMKALDDRQFDPLPSVQRLVSAPIEMLRFADQYPLNEEVVGFLMQENALSLENDQWFARFPGVQNLLLQLGHKVEAITIDTRNFLLAGYDAGWLSNFYTHKQVKVPGIFLQVVNGNQRALEAHLESNNPFAKDGYGLSLFELMIYLGMEKPALDIIEKNQYLPIEKETFFLALLGQSKRILTALQQKTNASDYATYFYQQALRVQNSEALQWLAKEGFSAENVMDGLNSDPSLLYLLAHTEVLQLLLESGLSMDHLPQEMMEISVRGQPRSEIFPALGKIPHALLPLAIEWHAPDAIEVLVDHLYAEGKTLDQDHLVYAATMGSPGILKVLLAKGLSLDQPGSTGVKPLEAAVAAGATDNVRWLIEQGTKIEPLHTDSQTYRKYRSPGPHTLIDIAGNLTTYHYLQEQNIPFSPFIYHNLDLAITFHDHEKAKALVNKYAYLELEKALRYAVSVNNETIGRWLLENHHFDGRPGYTLPVAHVYGQAKNWFFEACLTDKRYLPQLQRYSSEKGNSLLHDAVLEKNTGLIYLLLEAGFDPNLPNDQHFTPYYYANESEHFPEKEQVLARMQEKGASSTYNASIVQGAFEEALKKGLVDKVRKYLEQNADPNKPYSARPSRWQKEIEMPPLMIALLNKQELIAQLLLLYGADPNVSHESEFLVNRSPLSVALDERLYTAVRMLIHKGADLEFIPKSNSKYVCQYEIPLREHIDQLHRDTKVLLGWPDAQGNPPSLGYEHVDTLLYEAFEAGDLPAIRSVLTNYPGYRPADRDAFERKLFKHASLDMLKFMLNRDSAGFQFGYYDKGLESMQTLSRAAAGGRDDLVTELLQNYHYPLSRSWFASVLDANPMASTIRKGGRLYSPTLSYSAMEVPTGHVFLGAQQRQDYLDVIKAMAPSNFYLDSVCIIESVRSRFHEATTFFLGYPDNTDETRKAMLDIIEGDVSSLQTRLDAGLSPDASLYGFSLITCAAWMNRMDILVLLHEKGGSVKVQLPDGLPAQWKTAYLRPEFWAMIHGEKTMIEWLMQRGVSFKSLRISDYYGGECYTAPFLLMAQPGKRDVLEWLLREKVINAGTGCYGTSLLSKALKWDDPELVKLLLPPVSPTKEKRKPVRSIPYVPTNLEESIIYALRLNASQNFFTLVKTHDFDPKQLPADGARWIEDLEIQKWLLEQGFKLQSINYFHHFLQNALRAGDNQHFLELLKAYDTLVTKEPNQVYQYNFNKDSFDETIKLVLLSGDERMISALYNYTRTFEIKGEGELPWLSLAVEADASGTISWLLDREVDWITYRNRRVNYVPDLAKNYATWKIATEAIESHLVK